MVTCAPREKGRCEGGSFHALGNPLTGRAKWGYGTLECHATVGVQSTKHREISAQKSITAAAAATTIAEHL